MITLEELVARWVADFEAFRAWAGDTDFESLPDSYIDEMVKYWYTYHKGK